MTKLADLAAAIRGTMPMEPSVPLGPAVDLPIRQYVDAMAQALVGAVPVISPPPVPPGVPWVPPALPVYPAPLVPAPPGPHVVAASHGPTLPSPADAVLGQMHASDDGGVHIFTALGWKQLTLV